MVTECNSPQLEFHASGRREVLGRFDGGRITSNGGGLLLREVDVRLGMPPRLAACFTDYRNPNSVEHSVQALVAQRVYGLALGYEDLNDHDTLRADSLRLPGPASPVSPAPGTCCWARILRGSGSD